MWTYLLLSIKQTIRLTNFLLHIFTKTYSHGNKKNYHKKISLGKKAFYKIGAKIGKLASGIIADKDGLVEKADEVIESVKSTIQNITASKKSAPKKKLKTTTKKVAAKQLERVTKKTVKPGAVKKSSPSPKVSKSVTSKKITPAKVIKKAAKRLPSKNDV